VRKISISGFLTCVKYRFRQFRCKDNHIFLKKAILPLKNTNPLFVKVKNREKRGKCCSLRQSVSMPLSQQRKESQTCQSYQDSSKRVSIPHSQKKKESVIQTGRPSAGTKSQCHSRSK